MASKLTLYAQPYAYGGSGFYFHDFEEYEEKEAKSPHEEWMFEFIDGGDLEQTLFQAMEVNQGNLGAYFDALDDVAEWQLPALIYLLSYSGADYDSALDKVDDVYLFEGTPKEYAYEWVDDAGIENIDPDGNYFDYGSYGYDLKINGGFDPRNDEMYEGLDADDEPDEPDPDDYEDEDDYDDAFDDYEEEKQRWDDFKDAIEHYDAMTDREFGEYIVYEVYGGVAELPDSDITSNFDYDALVRSAETGGEWKEIDIGGTTYTVTNATSV